MTRHILRTGWILLLTCALAFSMLAGGRVTRVFAAGSIPYYPLYIAKDASFSGNNLNSGTPFAVYVTITGAPPNAACTGPKLRLMSASTGGTADANFRSWAAGTGEWLTDTGAWANFGAITTDESGNWSGWAFGAVPPTATNTYLSARIRCGGSNYSTDTAVLVNLMDMTTTGGWLEESRGTSRAGRAIAVKDGSNNIVGLYVAEDNGISDLYSGSGYYKIAVPGCTNCGYTIETWALSTPNTPVDTINTMGQNGCPANVTAGETTSLNSCTTPTAVALSNLNVTSPFAALAVGLFAAAGLVVLRKRR